MPLRPLRFRTEFIALSRAGVLRGGRKKDRVDMFCLWRIDHAPIEQSISRHCCAMRAMPKRKSTRNPYMPKGTHQPRELFLCGPSDGKPLTPREVDIIEEHDAAYWSRSNGDGDPRREDPNPNPGAFDDPLPSARLRAERKRLFSRLDIPRCELARRYRAFRRITRHLMPGSDGDSNDDSGDDDRGDDSDDGKNDDSDDDSNDGGDDSSDDDDEVDSE